MLEKLNPVFKLVCLALGVLVILQVSAIARRKSPLANFTPPTYPAPAPEAKAETQPKPTNSAPPSMPGRGTPPRMGRPSPAADLPAPVKARVDRIVESEILGQVMRRMPMALLGIAGREVFLRAPNGQTGMIHEGEELGGVKLIKVGINRVLVEQDGQPKELTVFSGFGSESLLPKGKDSSIESTPTSKH
jgi:hypothetical protein